MLSIHEAIKYGYDSMRWYGHVLRIVGGHVLRKALEFEVEDQRKKGTRKGQGRNRLREKA